MAQMLDPLGLFEHLQELQQALFQLVQAPTDGTTHEAYPAFCLQRCLTDPHPASLQALEHEWQQEALPPHVAAPVLPCHPKRETGSHAPSSDPVACASDDPSCQQYPDESSLSLPSMAEAWTESHSQLSSDDAS